MANTNTNTPTTQQDQWIIAINTVPVNRDEIVSGFFKENGIFKDNALIAGLIEKLAPLISQFMGDDLFNQISGMLYGGNANHTYLSVHKLDENGKPGPPQEILHAMGMELDQNGKPILGSDDLLIPVAVDPKTFANDPLYKEWKNNTSSTTTVLTGSKDDIYQGYSTMLDTTHQIFGRNKVQYTLGTGKDGKHCNGTAGELLSNLKSVKGGCLYTEETKKLGAGMTEEAFNTAAKDVVLTGDKLMQRVEDQKNIIENLQKEHTQNLTPQPSPPAAPQNVHAPGT